MAETYHSYHDLPPLAGICTMEDAMRPGLSVEACVERLKRYHYAFKRLHQIFTARITAEPIYELKMAFSLHAHLCAEHTTALRTRVAEMREPPLGLDGVPDPGLEIFFDEILGAPTTEELVAGLYEKAIPALKAALEHHLAETNWVADHPSVRVCRFALLELADMAVFGTKAVQQLVDVKARERMSVWLQRLDEAMAAAGSLDGTHPNSSGPKDLAGLRHYSAKPYAYDGHPKRDERFKDPYNMGVHAEKFLYSDRYPPQAKVLMMFYKRIREIDVPEMMASIITETPGKPWDYYRDMSRQLWDEARHALMGEIGFANLGIDWTMVMINFTWSLCLNTQITPIERHAVLFFIEQGLMNKTGKRYEWEVGVASQNPLAALFQDYDWADEVLHARIGREWYVSQIGSPMQAIKYGDQCWSKVLVDWKKWQEQGLTQHRNWWPDVYREACKRWGIEPDPEVLSYTGTYEGSRADLQKIEASG